MSDKNARLIINWSLILKYGQQMRCESPSDFRYRLNLYAYL